MGPDTVEPSWIGFRVAAVIPEPGTGSLFTLGLLALAARRRFLGSRMNG